MKILIDIKHPAQLNLFKDLSRELLEDQWDITICYLNRGKLPYIIAKEYKGFRTIPVGSSWGTKWSIIWNGNIKRVLTFVKLIKEGKYNICVAASSVPLALACRISGIPIIQFYDDPERKEVTHLNAVFSNQLFYPPIVSKTNKISVFNCLKEWSYLSPRRFRPKLNVLNKYDLAPHEYVFVREVSNRSFNYYEQGGAIICSFSKEINSGTRVLLSLEDKTIADKFPGHWTLLEEPVEDIHSLMYYAKLVVASGDSMAREGAMLGVPSIYCGMRIMKANEMLMKRGILHHLKGKEAVPLINEIMTNSFNESKQLSIRNDLLENWDDMVDFMKKQIDHYKYQ